MAKHSRGTKISNHPQALNHQVEQYESIDDNLLPDPEDLAKYHALDPTMIEWIKTRAEKEQDMRHRFMDEKINLTKSAIKKGYTLDMSILVISFLVLCLGMTLTYLLLIKGCIITGSLFGGGTLIFAVNAILNFRKASNNNSKQNLPEKK